LNLIKGQLYYLISQVLITHYPNQVDDAETLLIHAITNNENYGIRFNIAQCYAALSELHYKKGDDVSAKHHLNRAIEIMQECGADGWVERYRKSLAEIK
jgi:hypothetical protein